MRYPVSFQGRSQNIPVPCRSRHAGSSHSRATKAGDRRRAGFPARAGPLLVAGRTTLANLRSGRGRAAARVWDAFGSGLSLSAAVPTHSRSVRGTGNGNGSGLIRRQAARQTRPECHFRYSRSSGNRPSELAVCQPDLMQQRGSRHLGRPTHTRCAFIDCPFHRPASLQPCRKNRERQPPALRHDMGHAPIRQFRRCPGRQFGQGRIR